MCSHALQPNQLQLLSEKEAKEHLVGKTEAIEAVEPEVTSSLKRASQPLLNSSESMETEENVDTSGMLGQVVGIGGLVA